MFVCVFPIYLVYGYVTMVTMGWVSWQQIHCLFWWVHFCVSILLTMPLYSLNHSNCNSFCPTTVMVILYLHGNMIQFTIGCCYDNLLLWQSIWLVVITNCALWLLWQPMIVGCYVCVCVVTMAAGGSGGYINLEAHGAVLARGLPRSLANHSSVGARLFRDTGVYQPITNSSFFFHCILWSNISFVIHLF